MTIDELQEHMRRERAFMVEVWTKLYGLPFPEPMRSRLAGYDQGIADVETARASHEQGRCTLCQKERP